MFSVGSTPTTLPWAISALVFIVEAQFLTSGVQPVAWWASVCVGGALGTRRATADSRIFYPSGLSGAARFAAESACAKVIS